MKIVYANQATWVPKLTVLAVVFALNLLPPHLKRVLRFCGQYPAHTYIPQQLFEIEQFLTLGYQCMQLFDFD